MTIENEYYHHHDVRNIHDQCQKYMYHHVILTTVDGNSMDGIIEDVNNEGVNVLVGEDAMEQEMDDMDGRQFGGFGGYGFPRRRYRRFRRQFFPLAALTALALLPYTFTSPFPYWYY